MPRKRNMKNTTSRHMIIKLFKTLRTNFSKWPNKKSLLHREKEMTEVSLKKKMQVRKEGEVYLKH